MPARWSVLENLLDGEVDALHAVQGGRVNFLLLDMGEAVLACIRRR